MICWIFWETQLLLNRDLQTPDCLPHGKNNVKPNPRKPHTEPERITTETESCHAEQHNVESSSYVKPLPLIFIYDTGPPLPSLFQISEEWIFHQNLLLQGSRIVLHSEERVPPKYWIHDYSTDKRNGQSRKSPRNFSQRYPLYFNQIHSSF